MAQFLEPTGISVTLSRPNHHNEMGDKLRLSPATQEEGRQMGPPRDSGAVRDASTTDISTTAGLCRDIGAVSSVASGLTRRRATVGV